METLTAQKMTHYRWTICALVFFATTVNYLDRNVLGLLKTTLSEIGMFGEDKANQELYYSYVIMSFQIAYAVGMLGVGRIIDKVGTKRGYGIALLGWSFAAIGHAFAKTTLGFGFWRAALGVTESGNFPAANKTMAIWFPKKERALATGIYNSGTNIGAIIAPLTVPYIAVSMGWEWAFILTGAVGLIWLAFWYLTYKSPNQKLKDGKLSQAEFDYIHSDNDEAIVADDTLQKVSWLQLLRYRQTWAFFFGKFLTDPIWWFFLFWLPAFLEGENARHLAAGQGDKVIEWPFAVAVVYTVSTIGSILGGWLPKRLINGGMDANRARKTAMFIYALFPLSVLFASRLGEINTWFAVAMIAIACAAHQAWSANIFTTVSDMFPKKAVASVTGIGGMSGGFGGILIAWSAGLLLKHFTQLGQIEKGYGILFVVCALAYLVAWFVMHLFVPRFKKITDL
ncbi:MAG TPA: MFS transporter [Cyclobacteriaceae bacterium]|nr:MFS transporter [Cyclobacteriaceae bacterium]